MNATFKSFLLLSLVGLTACNQSPSEQANASNNDDAAITISDAATGSMETLPAALKLADGTAMALYKSKAGRVTLWRDGKEQILDSTAPVQGGQFVQLHENAGQVYASWWSHENNKNLYITHSSDGGRSFAKVAIINDQHGVLPRYSLSFGDKGVVGATYYDERSPRYEVYFNRSTDYGQTWDRPDTRLDDPAPAGQDNYAVEPVTVQADGTLVTVWDDAYKGLDGRTVYRLMTRSSTDQGITWSPAKMLLSSFHQISALSAKAEGKTVFVAFDEYQAGIKAVVSNDAGINWVTSPAIEGSSQKTNSGLVLTIANGMGYASWIEQEPNKKPDIQFGRFDLANNAWLGSIQRIDTKQFDNTQSITPSIFSFSNGNVVIAWVDYRDIRPNIYLSLSTDQGKTWSSPKPFGKPGVADLGWPKLIPWGDSVALAYESYPKDILKDGMFKVAPTNIVAATKELPNYASTSEVSAEQKKKMLLARVDDLWKYRKEGKYEPTYSFFDYAMRNFMAKKEFVEKSGNLNYYNYELTSTKIEGNVAQVEQKITYDTKPFMMPNGKMEQIKKTTAEVKNTWVWIGDNWYLVYAPSFGKPILQY